MKITCEIDTVSGRTTMILDAMTPSDEQTLRNLLYLLTNGGKCEAVDRDGNKVVVEVEKTG